MEMLDIEATISTPKVRFDASAGKLEISGESYPENSFEFYRPLLVSLKEHMVEMDPFQADIKIIYMNSSSVKCMLDIIDIMNGSAAEGRKMSINWFYDKENPRALELAEEFQEEVELEFNIIPVEGN